MTPMDVFTAVIALLAGGAVIYFFILPSATSPTHTAPQLFVEAPASTLPNLPISITVAASSATGKIIRVVSDEKEQTLTCNTDPCVFSVAFTYATPGTKSIVVQLDNLSASRSVEVTSVVSRCIDGTPGGSCAAPPLYCDRTQLVSNCTICGCDEGKQCISGTCQLSPLTFSITSFTASPALFSTVPATLNYSLQNTSAYSADGLFLLIVTSFDSGQKQIQEKAQQVEFSSVGASEIVSGNVRVLLSSSTKYIRLRLYDQPGTYPSSTLLAESMFVPVVVSVDTTPPQAPTSLHVSSAGNTTTLEWTASSSQDVDHYTVYRENFSNGGFTTYSNAGDTSTTSFVLPSPSQPLAYVVRAVDGAGNTSDPSPPVVVASP